MTAGGGDNLMQIFTRGSQSVVLPLHGAQTLEYNSFVCSGLRFSFVCFSFKFIFYLFVTVFISNAGKHQMILFIVEYF